MGPLLLLAACSTEPVVHDGGVADGGNTFPGRCAQLVCSIDGVCQENSPSSADRINGIWGSGSGNVFAAGSGGLLWRFDGSTWTSINSNTTVTLYDIWGTSATNVYAVCQQGTILHHDGKSWKAMSSGTKASLRSIWGSGPNDIFAVGGDSVTSAGVRFDGKQWSRVQGLEQAMVTLMDVHGTGPKRAAAVGYYFDNNKQNLARQVACKYDGAWSCSGPQQGGELYGIWLGDVGVSYVVGTCCRDGVKCGGLIQTQGNELCSPGTLDRAVRYYSVWGRSASELWISGAGGALLRKAGGPWQKLKTDTTTVLRALWAGPRDLLVGGEYGTLLRVCGN